MIVIFCDNGFGKIDELYSEEYDVCKELNIDTFLVSYSNICKQLNPFKSFKSFEVPIKGIYRGWMLTLEQYTFLYNKLKERNIELINNATQYEFAHHLPSNYEIIKDYSPLTTFKVLEGKYKYKRFKEVLEVFKGKSIIVKDWVKSQKHYWKEACFIPNVSDWKNTNKVIKKFIELQSTDLVGGLVFREFVKFEHLTNHSISDMPLTKEFRIFVMNGEVIAIYKYWDEGEYDIEPCVDKFKHLFNKINSNFFTMDIAKVENGDWMIVEIGDGQVSGLPENANKKSFYENLF